MPTIYIIAGCNGAGKSTAANVILPAVSGLNTKSRKTKDVLEEKFRKGSKLGVKELIEEHKKSDDHLIVSRNGKVVKVKAGSL